MAVGIASDPAFRGDVRLFFLEGDGDPEVVPSYEGYAIIARPTWSFGDITTHYVQSPIGRRRYTIIGKTSGAETPPEMPVSAMYRQSLSKWLRLGQQKCDHGLQAHIGTCGLPTDYNGGYEKILVLEKARIRSWGLDGNLGSNAPGDEGTVNEDVPFVGEIMYEIKKFDLFAQLGSLTTTRPIVGGVIADSVSCGGECGTASDGCSVVVAVSSSTVGSPGAPATVYYTTDGSTPQTDTVSTMLSTENADGVGFDGNNIVVLSSASDGIHYKPIADLIAGSGSWTKVTTGLVSTKGPTAIFVAGPRDIFIAGLGGYVYHSSNLTSGVTVLQSGGLTTEDLISIHGVDDQHVVVVGANNTVLITVDGETFASVTGPAPAVDLNKVWMVNTKKSFVAGADGFLYYTKNGGTTWAQSGFSGQGSGEVTAVTFATNDVGFMTHTTVGNVGRIFKTIDGGASWTILPEIAGGPSVPSHRRIYDILACDQNTFHAVGTSSSGNAGMWIKGL